MLRRYGAEVAIVESHERLLDREDPRLSEMLADVLREEGIRLHLGASAEAVSRGLFGPAALARVGLAARHLAVLQARVATAVDEVDHQADREPGGEADHRRAGQEEQQANA